MLKAIRLWLWYRWPEVKFWIMFILNFLGFECLEFAKFSPTTWQMIFVISGLSSTFLMPIVALLNEKYKEQSGK